MKPAAFVLLAALCAPAQIPGPRWYRSATGMLGVPAANADYRELQRMERYLTFGVPYCSGLAAAQYAANMAVARNMSSYLATVSTAATDPRVIFAARASALIASWPPVPYRLRFAGSFEIGSPPWTIPYFTTR